MKALTHKVNAVLKPLFANAGIDLVDYKLEFGHPLDEPDGPLVLGDEFTPDGCRLWDAKTGEKLDKDRFRRDLGDVIEHYREVGRRIGVSLYGCESRRDAIAPNRALVTVPSTVPVTPGSPVSHISSKRSTSGFARSGSPIDNVPPVRSTWKRCTKCVSSTISSGSIAARARRPVR